jgi:hypothetical protein
MQSRIFLLTFFIITSWSCKKTKVITTGFDNSAKVMATIRGKVFDENGNSLNYAKVSLNGKSISINDGIFKFEKQSVYKIAQVITVEVPGYFKMMKTVSNMENKETFTIIRMQKKTNPIIFYTETGAFIDQGGIMIELPRMAYVYKSTGQPYTGKISVFIKTFDPSKKVEFDMNMPGGNLGLDLSKKEEILSFLSIVGVELETENGEGLQLAKDINLKFTIPIPTNQQANSKDEIALSHLDEQTGLWVQEGIAKRIGNTYVATVSHFSFWGWSFNYPYPGSWVVMSFVDASGSPLMDMFASINNLTPTLPSGASCYLNQDGIALFHSMPNTTYSVNLFAPNCPNMIYSTTITTGAAQNNIMNIGPINIGVNSSISTIQLVTVDCNNNVVPNAKMELIFGGNKYYLNSDLNGNFTRSFYSCGNPISCTITAAGISEYNVLTYNLVPGMNSFGNFQCCGRIIPFVKFTAGTSPMPGTGSTSSNYTDSKPDFLIPFTFKLGSGNPYIIVKPEFNVEHTSSFSAGNTLISCKRGSGIYSDGYDFNLSFSGTPGNYIINEIKASRSMYLTGDSAISHSCSIPITISQYSSVPNSGYIEGSFSGFFYDIFNNQVNAAGNFLVDRNF